MNRSLFSLVIALGWVGCDITSRVATSAGLSPASSAGGGVSSGGATSSAISSGTTSTGASSGGTTTRGPTSTGSTGTTAGTGGSNLFEDGGYVYCSVSNAPDAGPNGDGGPASWMCVPGTYFCDLSGNLGNCIQCRSDADCADRSLPTYDPSRPRCDLGSGIAGYQGFCQECLGNPDCVGNAAGSLCDLNPTSSGAIEPAIEELGFETCSRLVTDCRSDGGPECHGMNRFCNQANGQCATRTGTCAADNDCTGFLNTPNMPDPYCVAGACSPCPHSICPMPYAICADDAQCGNPDGGPGGQSCEIGPSLIGICACTGSSQCGGIWPVCESLDAGNVNGLGQAIGVCGCDSDLECADAGFTCLMPGQPGSYCGIPCTSPWFIGCVNPDPVCDSDSGLCGPCLVDQECQANPLSGGPSCGENGSCGCIHNPDCPAGETCQAGSFYGTCSLTVRCTPVSCDIDNALSYFCDWDSGSCQNALTESSSPPCISDYDCSYLPRSRGPFCDPTAGCVRCRRNIDCADLSQGRYSQNVTTNYCCLPGSPAAAGCGQTSNTCTEFCSGDQDCAVLPGTVCVTQDGYSGCMTPLCTQDAGCGGDTEGERCELQPGKPFGFTCGCLVNSDCPIGTTCALDGGGFASCSSACQVDADCAPGFFCAPTGGEIGLCRPRCDDGYTCLGTDGRCDTKNALGLNGLGFLREQLNGNPRTQPEPGVVWCFQCLETSDCSGSLVCQQGVCGGCMQDSDCPSNACVDGICLTPCAAGSCPAGEVCDTLGNAGNGVDICYQCLSPADCPDGSGCNSATHTCGSCLGPNVAGGALDCPPGEICSSYWSPVLLQGACLQGCDARSCPADSPICAVLPALTPSEKFCFGCLQDSDCADAGAGAWCDVSVGLTFTCQLPKANPR